MRETRNVLVPKVKESSEEFFKHKTKVTLVSKQRLSTQLISRHVSKNTAESWWNHQWFYFYFSDFNFPQMAHCLVRIRQSNNTSKVLNYWIQETIISLKYVGEKRINHRNKYWQISKHSQTQIQWLIFNLELQNRKDCSQTLETGKVLWSPKQSLGRKWLKPSNVCFWWGCIVKNKKATIGVVGKEEEETTVVPILSTLLPSMVPVPLRSTGIQRY